MVSLAMVSQKGGVGKTTLALNLALAAARRGWRTLLVDGDPQGSIGLSLQGSAAAREGFVEYLEGAGSLARYIVETRVPELSILPAGAPSAERGVRWERALAGSPGVEGLLAETTDDFDLVLLDTCSGLRGSNLEVLKPVDKLLAPIQAEPLALRSMTQLLEAVGLLRQEGSGAQLVGFVVTMLSSRQEVSLSVAQEAWNLLPADMVLEAFVPRDPVFLVASAHGVPLGLLSQRPPPVATVFDRIVAELEPRLGLVVEEVEIAPVALLD